MRAYRIPERYIQAVRSLYTGSSARVRTKDGLTEPFLFHAGVKQGCVLSPFLFIMTIDVVMRRAVVDSLGVVLEKPGVCARRPGRFFTDTGFADDVAIGSDSRENLQTLTDRVVNEAKVVGLLVNVPKTMHMHVAGGQAPDQTAGGEVTVYNQPVSMCDDFKFLGSYVRSSEKDFEVRRALAWQAQSRLRSLWLSPLHEASKRKYFRSFVEPVLTYGAESWTMSESLSKKLDGTYTRLMRACMNVRWTAKRTNRDLYGDVPRLSVTLRQRRLRFAGHCARADQPVADVLLWSSSCKRRVGGKTLTYVDTLVADSKLTREELKSSMTDRDQWQTIVDS